MTFSVSDLAARLREWPEPARYVALVSGGCDSMVLMHALAAAREQLPAPLVVLHFNHGLSEAAPEWERFVAEQSRALGLPFFRERLALGPGPAAETRAREARYARLRQWMQDEDFCLSAHHADDQLETFFVHAVRGSGSAGLAGIAPLMPFGPGWLGRPLLEWTREALNAWAGRHRLEWVEDPANRDPSVPRNWVRMQLAPALAQRWPQAPHTVGRTARLAGEADAVLAEVAREDLVRLRAGHPACLAVDGLLALSAPRRRNLLRHWLRSLNLPLPSARRLVELESRFVLADPGGQAELAWTGARVRRFRNCLFAHPPWPVEESDMAVGLEPGRPLDLGYLGRLRLVEDESGPLGGAVLAGPLTVRFRRGGERLRPAGTGHRRTLKNLFREAAVLPWMRGRVPLLYSGDHLASVAGVVGASAEFAGRGWRLEWSGGPPLYPGPVPAMPPM